MKGGSSVRAQAGLGEEGASLIETQVVKKLFNINDNFNFISRSKPFKGQLVPKNIFKNGQFL